MRKKTDINCKQNSADSNSVTVHVHTLVLHKHNYNVPIKFSVTNYEFLDYNLLITIKVTCTDVVHTLHIGHYIHVCTHVHTHVHTHAFVLLRLHLMHVPICIMPMYTEKRLGTSELHSLIIQLLPALSHHYHQQ